MNDRIPFLVNKLTASPKHLFLVDGMGACLSASSLLAAGALFPELFGLPPKTLFLLAALALFFAIYSLSCARFLPKNPRFYLLTIAVANSSYCLLTIALALDARRTLTRWGALYVALEILVVVYLVRLEFIGYWKLQRAA